MRLKLYRPIYWSIFLLCISFNVPADERSSTQIIDSEIATSAGEERNLKRKPIVTLTKKLQNHSEFVVESIGKKELRSNKHTAFDGPPHKTLQNHSQLEIESIGKKALRNNMHAAFGGASLSEQNIRQYLALNSVKNEAQKNQSSFVKSKHIQRVKELESIAVSGLRNSEQIVLMKPPSRKSRMDREAIESVVETENNERPVFMQADLIQGHDDLEVEGIGNAELITKDEIITADRMKYYQDSDDIEVEGDVRIERTFDIVEGSRLKMNLETKVGQMGNPIYQLKDGSERGDAKTLIMKGDNLYRYKLARYTTCPEGNEDWIVEADNLEIDDNDKTGTASGAWLKFLGMPIGYTPWGSFSYSGERKTGVLAPIYSVKGRTGVDVSVPFYWNIAPNMDATFKARGMSKRGVMINNEFRYKTSGRFVMNGGLYYDILPHDKMTGENRNRLIFEHSGAFGKGWSYGLNYNRVSDDLFMRDLGKGLKVTSRTQLLQQAKLGYFDKFGTGIIRFSAQAQQFQTVQDPARPATAPYKKLPQVLLRATQRDVLGLDLGVKASYTEFSHRDTSTNPNKAAGQRYTFFPNVSKPIENSFGFITPKFGLHHTGYMLNRSTANIPNKNISRTIPIMSLDSGLTATRETKIFGEEFNQTIEPRLFYVYVPYKNQSHMPTFDSGIQGFSFGRIFSENKYSGNDRINDANRVTMSLTSRLIDESTGVERFRVAIAKQVHLTKPKVGVVANPKRNSDIILKLIGKITPALTAKHTMQIDHSKSRTDVMRSIVSYQPEIGKVINLGYRYTRGVLAQYDISGQWPITKRLRLVARKNYSLRNTGALSELIGIEYNACCWTARFVAQRLRTSSTRTNTTFFLQLELGGLMQIGSDPLRILTRGIQGYTNFDGRRNENDNSELR